MKERFIPVMGLGRKMVKGEVYFLFDDVEDRDLTRMDVFKSEEGIFSCVRVYHPRDKRRILSLFDTKGILRAVGSGMIKPFLDEKNYSYWFKFLSEKALDEFKKRALRNRVFVVEMSRYKKFLYDRWNSDSNNLK